MDINKEIDFLIESKQYSLDPKEKEEKLFPILIEQIKKQVKDKKLMNFYNRLCPLNEIKKIEDIPPIPVSLFKKYDFKLVPDNEVTRTLTSSGTTTQLKSKIYLDKITAFRQRKALSKIIENYLGNQRKPMIILDTESINNPKNSGMSARGAAVRGLIQFGKEIIYAFDGEEKLELNLKRVEDFIKLHKDESIILFGFTYLIWEFFYKPMKELNKLFQIKGTLLHSGGWKKLENEKVSKEHFNQEIEKIFGLKKGDVKDMYGMVEQVGIVFIDCEEGNKHIPNFAEVIIRDPLTLKEVKINKEGIIEILSVLPDSYPGQAILTEDMGVLLGNNNCKCGRGGKYFRFVSRIKESEARGCGDTYQEKKK
jgi:hypothetical protein